VAHGSYTKASKKQAEIGAVKRRVFRASLCIALYIPLCSALTAVICGAVLRMLNRAYASLGADSELRFYPHNAIWFILGALIGGCVAFLTCSRVYRYFLGPPPSVFVPEYEIASWPLPAALRTLYLAASIGLCLIALANLRKHAVLTASEIIDQRATALLPSHYPYADIARIAMSRCFIPASKYRRAAISNTRSLFVWFRDGRRWSLKDSGLSGGDEKQGADYLARRCGLVVEYPDTALDVPRMKEIRQREWTAFAFATLFLLLVMAATHARKRHFGVGGN